MAAPGSWYFVRRVVARLSYETIPGTTVPVEGICADAVTAAKTASDANHRRDIDAAIRIGILGSRQLEGQRTGRDAGVDSRGNVDDPRALNRHFELPWLTPPV